MRRTFACAFWGLRGRVVLAVVAAAVVGLAGAGSALAATDTLDQSQTVANGLSVVASPSFKSGLFDTASFAQTFTAGLSGPLDRVSLDLGYGELSRDEGGNGGSSPSNDLAVDITAVNGSGAPDMAHVLATGSISKSNTYSIFSPVFYDADFATPPAVSVGTQYAIVAYASGSDEYDWWADFPSNPYADGHSCGTSDSPPTSSISWNPLRFGFAFKTYVETTSDLATTLVADSTGIGPGKALPNKAAAIQTAVNANPPQTATACAGITDYLGLVKAQTGKKLTQPEAAVLTTDANNLAAALGC